MTDVPKIALILAGGKGTRLRPLTDNTPKSLVDLNGQPIMQYNIDLCKRHGVTDIILSVGHMKEQIKEYYGDGSNHGLRITYVEEDEPLGTAGCLRLLKDRLNEPFLMMNADELKDINLKEMFRIHKEAGVKGTLSLTQVEDPTQFGVVVLENDKIVGFVEKPSREEAPSNLISAGLYILEPSVIDMLPEGFCMVEKDLFPRLAKESDLAGHPFSGQWFNTDSMDRLDRAKAGWQGFKN